MVGIFLHGMIDDLWILRDDEITSDNREENSDRGFTEPRDRAARTDSCHDGYMMHVAAVVS